MVKEELCENVVKVGRRCDRVMAIGLVFKKEAVRVICAYAPQRGKPDAEKERFYEKMVRKWSMGNANHLVLGLRISMVMLGNVRKDWKVYMKGME